MSPKSHAGRAVLCLRFLALPAGLKTNIHVWLRFFCRLENLPFGAVKQKAHFAHFSPQAAKFSL